jgi:hypothetical protein
MEVADYKIGGVLLMSPHALVIGGSGMLAEACLWLVQQGYHVSVIGRSKKRLQTLADRAGGPAHLTPISLDYRRDAQLQAAVTEAIAEHGPVDLVLAWIHSTAPQALDIVAAEVERHSPGAWRLFQVRGSNAYLEKDARPQLPARCLYRKVILGFVLEGEGSRWLTHEEIAGGVIEAMQGDKELHIVATCEPWAKRP